jgi:general secretion pathway protein G
MKTRKGGFTLVELLIVIVIISILAGMMLLATGSATDNAEAVKVTNDLRYLKSAALLFYSDHLLWPVAGSEAALNNYSDRPIVRNGGVGRYDVTIGAEYSDPNDTTIARTNIGLTLEGAAATAGVRNKLAKKAAVTGLLNAANTATTPYDGNGSAVWMNMR